MDKPDPVVNDYFNELQFALKATLNAAEVLRSWSSKALGVEWKEDESPVTLADRDAHRLISTVLKASGIPILSEEGRDIPHEERASWKSYWLVDPLDGTKEFIKRRPEYTVNIALMIDNEPRLGVIGIPEQHLIYVGVIGQGAWKCREPEVYSIERRTGLPQTRPHGAFRVIASRSHMNPDTLAYVEKLRAQHGEIEFVQAGSALKFCRLAEGLADVYPRFVPCMEWDTAAGHALIRACGKEILRAEDGKPLQYNKADLLNPYFIAG